MTDDAQSSMPDMGSLLGMAMEMQQQMVAAQAEAAHTVVEGQAGGGAVRIEVTGGLEFRSVTIAPDAVDPNDVDMLQDLVLAALHDAVARVNELAQANNPLAGFDVGGLDMGNVDLGGLGGMLGLAAPVPVGEAGANGLGAIDGNEADQDDDDQGGAGGPAPRG
jgi:DNA-binding YbaB/EbfC family protein